MANTHNRNEVVYFEDVMESFSKDSVISNNVGRTNPGSTDMQRQGDTFWRPVPYIAETVDGMDITGLYDDLKQLSVPGSLSHIKNVPWKLDAKEMRDEWYMKQQSIAAGQSLSAAVETAIATNIAFSGSLCVKRGALSGYDDIAEAQTRMTEIGVPRHMRKFSFNARDNAKVASNLAARETINQRPDAALNESSIGRRLAGFDVLNSDLLPRLTAATTSGAVTVNGADQVLTPASTSTAGTGEVSNVDNRWQNLVITKTTDTTFKVGDRFTIAGVNHVHLITKEDTGQPFTLVVQSVVAQTTTAATLRVTAMIADGPYKNVTAAPADDAAITFLNTTSTLANVFWHQSSVEIIGGQLAVDDMGGMLVQKGTTENGITVCMFRQSNIDDLVQKYRFSIFFGTVNLNPLMNGVLLGGQS